MISARTDEAATLHCPYCGHDARCWPSTSVVESPEQVVVQTQCSCQHFHCSEVGLQAAYICGSDGNSYAGVCQMRLEACKQRKEIHLLYSGRCRSSGKSPSVYLTNVSLWELAVTVGADFFSGQLATLASLALFYYDSLFLI